MPCYNTCDPVKSIKTVIYSNDVQERNSPIFKSLSGRKKALRLRTLMQQLQNNCGPSENILDLTGSYGAFYLSEMLAACT